MTSRVFDTRFGALRAVVSDDGIRELSFGSGQPGGTRLVPSRPTPPESVLLSALERWLDAYFSGQAPEMDLSLAPSGTDFQRRVWDALLDIPYGSTCSYEALTATLGDPLAIRAVAAANGRNPIAILIPCHRVVGKDGSLTGYAGGLERKRGLLMLEAGVVEQVLFGN